MNTTIPIESVCDSEAARLLPWFVTGRLSTDDRVRVSRHVEECAICRADVEGQRAIRATMHDDGPVEYAPQAGLAKTLARIDEMARHDAEPSVATERQPAATNSRRFGVTQWLTAAVVVQAIGLGALAAAFMNRGPATNAQAAFETLSTPTAIAATPLVRTVFAASMTMGQLKTLLTAQRLLIVAGPSEAGVFTLGAAGTEFGANRLDASLAEMRANPNVLFAEPVNVPGAKLP